MKITGWTCWDNPEYKKMPTHSWDDKNEVEMLIAEELRKHGYKFTGSYHQEGYCGVPIIDDTWLYQCSCRTWGHIMQMAYPEQIDNSDGYGYTLWAWLPPESETIPNDLKV